MNRWKSVALVAVCLLLTGCGNDDAPEKYTVTGEVTWNGEKLPEGDIIFIPVDTKLQQVGGKIQEGKYELQAPAGEMKVQIRATKEDPTKTVPGIEPGTTQKGVKQYIPANYNDNTTLTATVTKEGPNDFPFKLEGPE